MKLLPQGVLQFIFSSNLMHIIIYVSQEGTSNYFKGLMLILCYLIVAASFFVHVDPNAGKYSYLIELLDAGGQIGSSFDGLLNHKNLTIWNKRNSQTIALFPCHRIALLWKLIIPFVANMFNMRLLLIDRTFLNWHSFV